VTPLQGKSSRYLSIRWYGWFQNRSVKRIYAKFNAFNTTKWKPIPRIRILLKKLPVAQLVKIFQTIRGNPRFTRFHHSNLPIAQVRPVHIFTPYSFKILPSMPRSRKYLPFRFSDKNSYHSQPCYMSRPSDFPYKYVANSRF